MGLSPATKSSLDFSMVKFLFYLNFFDEIILYNVYFCLCDNCPLIDWLFYLK